MTKFQFEDAVAVVTGAGNGMGRSIALAAAGRGMAMLVSDLAGDDARRVADEIVSNGGRAIGVATDVADAAAVQALADEAYSTYGKVDLLVNNAGVTMRPFRAIWDAADADFRWMMEVNYFGVVNGLRSFLPRMLEQTGRRQIVNTSSMATISDVGGHGMYTASKAALDAISNTLRVELADHDQDFGVTIPYPGPVRTDIAKRSEGQRPTTDRSANRDVTPYPFAQPVSSDTDGALDPIHVGEMVMRAIEADASSVTTHPANESLLLERVRKLVDGYFPAEVHA